MNLLFHRRRSGLLMVFAGSILLMAGCDQSPAGERLTLQPRSVTLRFEFGQMTQNQVMSATSVGQVSLSGNLDGFELSDIVAARIQAVRMSRLSPLQDAALSNLMEQVTLRLSGPGTLAVASASSLTGSSLASLSPTGVDLRPVVRSPSFFGTLEFTPKVTRTANFVIEVTLDLVIEVEGL